jgi:hypothetical protein
MGVQDRLQGPQVEAIEPRRFVDRPLQRPHCEEGGKIEQGASRSRDRQTLTVGDLTRRQAATMKPDPSAADAPAAGSDRDVDDSLVRRPEPPEICGSPVAQHRPVAAGE